MRVFLVPIIVSFIITVVSEADAGEASFSSVGRSFSNSGYYPRIGEVSERDSDNRIRATTGRSARRQLKVGGLMLGIGWAVPAVVGLILIDAGSPAMGARMLIPFYGFAEAGVKAAAEFVTLAIPLFFPSIVQLVGACLLLSGASKRNRYRRIAAAPVIYREGGGGLGVSFAL